MRLPRGLLMLVAAAVVWGLLLASVYGTGQGIQLALFMVACGTPAIAGVHLLAAKRRSAGRLARQFGSGIVVTSVLVILGVSAIGVLMLISPRDAMLTGLLVAFAGGLAAYSFAVLARGVFKDIESVRDALHAIGEGSRAPRLSTGGRDELAELAGATSRMAARLSASEAERESAETARRQLVAAVSHDLRTPLTSLRLLANAVEDDLVDDATRREYLAQMTGHVDSLAALVDDLFELSRLEAGDIQWSLHRVALDELINDTVAAMRPHALERKVRVVSDVAGVAPARANPEQLQRVLFNLIQNAIRHTPADGSVTVSGESDGTTVEIVVADTGSGLDPEQRDRVFEPFFRVDESRAGDHSGLGLTICRAIVQAHGGRIWLEDSEVGARFRFSVPQAPPLLVH